MAEYDGSILTGDDFRLELTLANKNRLPIYCKAIYRFPGKGIGLIFQEISQFEQELLGTVICLNLENEGLPLLVNPFTQPPTYFEKESSRPAQISEVQLKAEELMDDLMATEG